MAWTTPLTAVANATLTASQWNASVRDNLNETAPGKATAGAQIFVATAANTIAARTPATAQTLSSQTTTSTSFTDLTTVGPTTGAMTTGASVLTVVSCKLQNNTAGAVCFMGVDVSGASTRAADDNAALTVESSAANDLIAASYVYYRNDLTAGSNTFLAKYRVTAGTGTFEYRRIQTVQLS